MQLEGGGCYLDLLDGMMPEKEAIIFEKMQTKNRHTTKCRFTRDTYFDK
jgi:hypothetical protein